MFEVWKQIEENFPDQYALFGGWWKDYRDPMFADMKIYHLPEALQWGIVFKFFREVFEMSELTIYDVTSDLELEQMTLDGFAQKFMTDRARDLE